VFLTGILFLIASLAMLVWAIAVAFDDRDEGTLDDTVPDAAQEAAAFTVEDRAVAHATDRDAEDADAQDAASRRTQSTGFSRDALMA
jgi:hypothetical protein